MEKAASDDGQSSNDGQRSPECVDMSGPSSPKQPEKRLKVDNDRYRNIENTPSSESISDIADKDDNIDSGISAGKSLSTVSEDITNSAGPSTSVTSFSKNTGSNKKNRNYRRRIIDSGQSTDSDDCPSERDETGSAKSDKTTNQKDNGESRPIVSLNPVPVSMSSEGTPSEMAYFNSDSDDDDEGQPLSSSSSSGSDEWTDIDTSTRNGENSDEETPAVLLKKNPEHKWFFIKELMLREMGMGFGPGQSGRDNGHFERGFYGSLNTVQKLELMYKLEKHDGCVNSISFHPQGHLLASGSDDLNIVIWDWATNTPRHVLKSGHKSNVFQSKFMHLNAGSQLNVVSCARDGQVRLMQIPPSGGNRIRVGDKRTGSAGGILKQRLAQHSRAANKLHVTPAEPHVVFSAGEDGVVFVSDVRTDKATLLVKVRDRSSIISLYSIQGHPLDPKEFVVSGSDKFVRVYDRRKAGPQAKPIHLYCPSFFLETPEPDPKKKKRFSLNLYVTCAVYNHLGTEILATYNDDDIYLFDSVTDRYSKDCPRADIGYTYRYSGHRNSATFKGVSFFGPNSEFVVSGSDCGNIYIWEKKSEAIVQWMMGDEGGVVNCVECHPRFPILATSGLDKDVKIWVPSNEVKPSLKGLREIVADNNRAQMRHPLFPEILGTSLYSFLGGELRPRNSSNGEDASGEEGDDDGPYGENVCTAF